MPCSPGTPLNPWPATPSPPQVHAAAPPLPASPPPTPPLSPCRAPLGHPPPALPQGRQHLGSHSPSTWGPPRPGDGISLSLATTNTQAQTASLLPRLLLSPWRPQCHRGGSLAKATTVTQHPPGPQLPPRGHHQHSHGDSDSLSSRGSHQPQPRPRQSRSRPPACKPAASSCLTAPPRNSRRWIRPGIDSDLPVCAPSPSGWPPTHESPPTARGRKGDHLEADPCPRPCAGAPALLGHRQA